MAKLLAESGAKGLVLFNRFYQPEHRFAVLECHTKHSSQHPMAMRLPLRWIAILYGRIQADLAGTSGIHRATDVVKMLMAGADVTMLCSVLIRKGIGYIADIERELAEWLELNEYDSVEQLKGTMSQKDCPVPEAFERAQYMRGIATALRAPDPVPAKQVM
jgi:dihydroorotate dehydrogenase (fumarate)